MASTLADHLRALPDDGLMALIRMRPDLVIPPPADFSALAHRAQSRVSVARTLDGLDRFTLEVLDALRYTRDGHTTSIEAVLTLTATAGVEAARVRSAIDHLRALALVFGTDQVLRVAGAVDEVTSPYPAGLGRPAAELDPAAAALVADPAGLRRALLAAPPAARAVLDRLAAGPPIGAVAPASLAPGSDSPVRWLVDAHLLVVVADDAVELPNEVGLLLRRDAGPLGALHPDPPLLASTPRDPAAIDRAGAGQVLEVVRTAEALLEVVSVDPPSVLRSGGLGVRDLRKLAKAVGLDEAAAGVLVEVVTAAGLLGEETSGTDGVFLPTAAYDAWRAAAIATRWRRLALAWLTMTRAPALIGQRDERDRPVNALSPEVTRPNAPAQRRAALDVIAGLAPGATPTADDVIEALAWREPRRIAGARDPQRGGNGVAPSLTEAALIGITGSGGLTSYGRVLMQEALNAQNDGDDPLGVNAPESPDTSGAIGVLDELLPPPVDHVLLQADLTMVVPGPPEPALAGELDLVGVAESASVFRVTPDSIRRSLDAGYSAADLHALFKRRSRTPVPQTLTYLIDDVARRHGGLRVGSAGSYVRSDDEALVAEVLADRRLAGLGLRRLAPTVLASRQPTRRFIATEAVGAMAVFLCSPAGQDITGATLPIDGGWSIA